MDILLFTVIGSGSYFSTLVPGDTPGYFVAAWATIFAGLMLQLELSGRGMRHALLLPLIGAVVLGAAELAAQLTGGLGAQLLMLLTLYALYFLTGVFLGALLDAPKAGGRSKTPGV